MKPITRLDLIKCAKQFTVGQKVKIMKYKIGQEGKKLIFSKDAAVQGKTNYNITFVYKNNLKESFLVQDIYLQQELVIRRLK